jgi:hypothetical protein
MLHDPENTEEEQFKDVYAYFGLAAYYAQSFETSLELLLFLHHRHCNSPLTQRDLDVFNTSLEKKTLGKLINDLRDTSPFINISHDIDEILDTARKNRNFLIHDFFKQRSVLFMSEGGRERMIAELVEIGNSLKLADTVIVPIYTLLSKAMGITEEMIETEMAKWKAEANSFNA